MAVGDEGARDRPCPFISDCYLALCEIVAMREAESEPGFHRLVEYRHLIKTDKISLASMRGSGVGEEAIALLIWLLR